MAAGPTAASDPVFSPGHSASLNVTLSSPGSRQGDPLIIRSFIIYGAAEYTIDPYFFIPCILKPDISCDHIQFIHHRVIKMQTQTSHFILQRNVKCLCLILRNRIKAGHTCDLFSSFQHFCLFIQKIRFSAAIFKFHQQRRYSVITLSGRILSAQIIQ